MSDHSETRRHEVLLEFTPCPLCQDHMDVSGIALRHPLLVFYKPRTPYQL